MNLSNVKEAAARDLAEDGPRGFCWLNDALHKLAQEHEEFGFGWMEIGNRVMIEGRGGTPELVEAIGQYAADSDCGWTYEGRPQNFTMSLWPTANSASSAETALFASLVGAAGQRHGRGI